MFRTGIAALAPEAQKAWIERRADILEAENQRLRAIVDIVRRRRARFADEQSQHRKDWRSPEEKKLDALIAALGDNSVPAPGDAPDEGFA